MNSGGTAAQLDFGFDAFWMRLRWPVAVTDQAETFISRSLERTYLHEQNGSISTEREHIQRL